MAPNEGRKVEPDRSLLSLRPIPQTEHEIYFEHLRDALTRKESAAPRNIALSGGYGTGKSSILERVASEFEKRVVRISFSTLGAVPERSHIEREETVLDTLQKEIVKQILYTEPPARVSGSRFDRLDAFHWRRAVFFSAVVGITIAGVLAITGIAYRLEQLAVAAGIALWSAYLLGILMIAVVGAFIQFLLQGVRLGKVSSGTTSIELADASQSYFDQYLDEIVYFFQQSRRDIVLFEDLDRFETSSIFEELRELNTLLNGATQIGRPIRFVYAVRDSLFQKWSTKEGGDALAESAAVRRTKFFDLVVPVVPFIGQRSAREHLSELIETADVELPEALVSLVARSLPEMRLLKNIVNEFRVFDRVASIDEAQGFDNKAQRFAMVVFKNLRPLDFENIQYGGSSLNTVYDSSRRLIVSESDRLTAELASLSGTSAGAEAAAQLALQAGRELVDHVARTLSVTQSPTAQFGYRVDGTTFDAEQAKTEAFWDALYRSSDRTLHVEHRGLGVGDFPFPRLLESLQLPPSEEQWTEAGRRELSERQADLRHDLSKISRANFSDLFARVDLVDVTSNKHLRGLAEDLFGKDSLPFELLARGYIDQHFNLYVTRFKGLRLTAAAATYLVQTIERQGTDPEYQVGNQKAVEALIEQAGSEFLGEPSGLNLEIFDALLGKSVLAPALDRLAAPGPADPFVSLYMTKGTKPDELVRGLASRWPGVFTFLASTDVIDESDRLAAITEALGVAKTEIRYETSDDLAALLGAHLKEISVSLSGRRPPTVLATIVARLDGMAQDLASLEPAFGRALAGIGSYKMNEPNLKLASGAPSISLDKIVGTLAFTRALASLDEYVDLAARSGVETIAAQESAVTVLRELASAGINDVRRILQGAAKSVVVTDWEEVAGSQRPAVVASRRLANDFDLIQSYLADYGMDDSMAGFLAEVRLIDLGDADPSQGRRRAMATSILNSAIPTESKLELVRSLRLDTSLPADTLTLQEGDYLRELAAANIVPDNDVTWAAMSSLYWETKAIFLAGSRTAATWIGPTSIGGPDLEAIFADRSPSLTNIKSLLLQSIASYVPSAGAWGDILRFAIREHVGINDEELIRAAVAGAPSDAVLPALLDTGRPFAVFQSVLTSLNGEYAKVAHLGHGQVKFDDDDIHRRLGDALTEFEIVNVEKDKGILKFNLRHPKE